jgi:hypothetical protein
MERLGKSLIFELVSYENRLLFSFELVSQSMRRMLDPDYLRTLLEDFTGRSHRNLSFEDAKKQFRAYI